MSTVQNSTGSTACMEHQVFEHIKQALLVTLNWQAPAVSMPRKLSSLQFTIKSFQRHFDRVVSIEEEGGYMDGVADAKPYMYERIQQLARDHGRFRERLRKLIPQLNGIREWEEPRFDQMCHELRLLITDIDRHNQQEIELLQDSLLVEDGGEG
ncbi:MAG TPA: hemerythrin domain-containing protein [Lacipirellulaceae bacterium]|nr:hemerythrin domain-containing protein [Lacipirellulaceae bacterium]